MLELKVKKLHQDAKLPTKANPTDAGWDLYSVADVMIPSGKTVKVDTGIALEIPTGYVGVIFDRSSMGSKGIHRHCGVIDCAYRGPLMVCLNNTNLTKNEYLPNLYNLHAQTYEIKAGDKVAQILILPVPEIQVVEVAELGESDRGEKGFGSSGR